MSALHDSTNVVAPGGARKRQRVAGSFLDILEEAGVSFDDEGSSQTTGASSGKRSACGQARRKHLAIEAPKSAREGAAPSLGVAQSVCASLSRMVVRVIVRRLPSPPRCPPVHLHSTHTPFPPAHPPPSAVIVARSQRPLVHWTAQTSLVSLRLASPSTTGWPCVDLIRCREHVQSRTKTAADSVAFVDGLKESIADEGWLLRSMCPLRVPVRSGLSEYSNSDSLVRLLLRAESHDLQPLVLEVLVDHVMTLAVQIDTGDGGDGGDDGDGSSAAATGQASRSLAGRADEVPRRVLGQLRWLDYLEDSDALVDKLLQCLQICPPDLKREVVAMLPDIVEDDERRKVVDALQDQMSDDRSMTVSVLDALTNLSLPSEEMDSVMQPVLDTLNSANVHDLPVVVRFLMQMANADNMDIVVEELRTQLSLTFAAGGEAGNEGRRGGGSGGSSREGGGRGRASAGGRGGAEALTLEAIRSGLCHRADMATAFFSAIASKPSRTGTAAGAGARGRGATSAGSRDGASETRDCLQRRLLDIWVLIAMYSSSSHRIQVQKCMKSLLTTRIIDGALLGAACSGHGEALGVHFQSLAGTRGRHDCYCCGGCCFFPCVCHVPMFAMCSCYTKQFTHNTNIHVQLYHNGG